MQTMKANAREIEEVEEVTSVVEDTFTDVPKGGWLGLDTRAEWPFPDFLPDICLPSDAQADMAVMGID
jgi:hypothetical protein